jgi:hypothetical protein
MRYLIVFGLIFFNSCKSVKQPKSDMININSINVYKDFEGPGYTTIGALTHFNELKKEGIETIRVFDEDKERLEQIVYTAKQLKHFQRKLAGGLFFCDVTFDLHSSENRIVIGTGETDSIIMDLTNRIDYKITNPEDLKWLSNFTERIKNQ